jgi:hypothetical protein
MVENVIFAEQDLAFSSSGIEGLYLWQVIPATVALTDGVEYTVRWDSQTYLCTAITANLDGIDCVGIGNLALAGLGENTGEPFLIGAAADGSFAACYTTDNKETIPVAIYQTVEEETTDDSDYLIKGSTLTAIAKAIRAKTGKADPIPVVSMATEIGSITGGGGGSSDDVCYVTFKSYDGTVEYGKKAVAVGDDCADPIARGLFDTPTRESTVQYNYTFYGWATTPNGAADADWNKSITEDKTVYANFASAVRHYTITYYDGDTVLKTESLAYGAMPAYAPKKAGYVLLGWEPEFTAVTGNASYYSQWKELSGFSHLLTMVAADLPTNAGGMEYGNIAINNAGTLIAFAFGSRQNDGSYHLPVYNIGSGTPVKTNASGGINQYSALSFNYDDTMLLTEGYVKSATTHYVQPFEVNSLWELSSLSKFSNNSLSTVACSPVEDVRGYLSNTGGTNYKWNQIVDGTAAGSFSLGKNLRSAKYSPDGTHIAFVTSTSGVAVYSIDGTLVADNSKFTVGGTYVKSISYNSDGSLLAVSYSQAPWVEVYETTSYTKVCELSDIVSATSFAELMGDDIIVVGSGASVQVRKITKSGHKAYEYDVPAYEESGDVVNIVKNHNSTRVVIQTTTKATVWALS